MSQRRPAHRAVLISFSGIDGAGKSTQIAYLCSRLREAGLTVKLVTFWDDVARWKAVREGAGHKVFKGDKGVGTPEAPIRRRDKNVRSPLMTAFRMGLYLNDAMSLRGVAAAQLYTGADVVVFDRYLYDELANLNLANAAIRFYLRRIMRLVPTPDVGFILDADPAQAFARKPEYPLDFLHSNRNAYLALSRFLGGMTVVPPLCIEEAKASVLQTVFRHPAVAQRTGVSAPE